MGAWGIKTFENDGALDWLGEFLEAPSEKTILDAFDAEPVVIQPGFLGKLMGKKQESFPRELEGDEILAAAEVTAVIMGRPASENPDELLPPPVLALSPTTPSRALAAISKIMDDSNLKDCWEESDDFGAWKREVDDLRLRLKSI